MLGNLGGKRNPEKPPKHLSNTASTQVDVSTHLPDCVVARLAHYRNVKCDPRCHIAAIFSGQNYLETDCANLQNKHWLPD